MRIGRHRRGGHVRRTSAVTTAAAVASATLLAPSAARAFHPTEAIVSFIGPSGSDWYTPGVKNWFYNRTTNPHTFGTTDRPLEWDEVYLVNDPTVNGTLANGTINYNY